jgi:hypothetical protein
LLPCTFTTLTLLDGVQPVIYGVGVKPDVSAKADVRYATGARFVQHPAPGDAEAAADFIGCQ